MMVVGPQEASSIALEKTYFGMLVNGAAHG